ncbi:asparagine synthase-related protein [Saccharothrix xinjiangensis]|uniref:asparagine synthase (glutamine-hydrolyzing) n=1 Tax=Saccharothrix xinjiangensis TaxID=204798 RepID=A0ABV9XZU1_9PSEU
MTEGWLALPDTVAAGSWIGAARAGSEVVSHASGRPWLVGRWQPGECTVAEAGLVRVAVIGCCPVTATRLCGMVAGVRRVAELDAVARALPGSVHVVASVEGVLRVQGGLAGLRQVFHARRDGITVAGDRADVLAALVGAEVDERMLAARIACGPRLPSPLGERSMWRGVRALEPDHYLHVDTCGDATAVRWWRPPAPDTSLDAGAGVVGEALHHAVAARTGAAGASSADLSGGMDSTSLCFLAARDTPGLVTFRSGEIEAGNDDAGFAALAIRALPRAEHLVLPPADMPTVYADPTRTGDAEAPYPFARTHAITLHTAAVLAGRGSRRHLAGHGGDELFHEGFAYLRDTLRHHPLTGFAHLRGHRALHRWPLAATVTALTDNRTLAGWWRDQARCLTDPPPARRTPTLGWGSPLRAADWVTPAAVEAARGLLLDTAGHARPLADERGQHATLAVLRTMGPAYRRLARLFATAGITLEMPYFDDRVIEAALSVRPHERRTPGRYKPLLAEAMRGVLPPEIAGRSTKGEFGENRRIGLRRNLPALLDMFADSALAAQGVIDVDVLRARLLAPQVDNSTAFALERLLGCETWLRTTTTNTNTVSPGSGKTDEPATAS